MVKHGPFNPCGLRLSSLCRWNWVEPEPEAHATFRSGGERSNPLSYAGLNKSQVSKKSCDMYCFLPLFPRRRQYRAALAYHERGEIDGPSPPTNAHFGYPQTNFSSNEQ